MKPDVCIYHANCADGFTAAWVVWRKYGDVMQYVPASYGDAPPDVADKHVLVVDFSYPRDVLAEMGQAAKSVVVLDHHKTAAEALEMFAAPRASCPLTEAVAADYFELGGVLGFKESHGRVLAEFDVTRSGAQMAWDYLNPGERRPNLVEYVADRDLWLHQKIWTREVSAVIASHDFSFPTWSMLESMTSTPQEVIRTGNLGKAVLDHYHRQVREAVGATRRTMMLGGQEVPVACVPYSFASDSGHLLCTDLEQSSDVSRSSQFAATYCDTPEGRHFSLRSTDAGRDVGEVARSYGGGGHRNAAGFLAPRGWEGDGDPWPPPPPEDVQLGWSVPVRVLREIQGKVEGAVGEQVSLEVVESVLVKSRETWPEWPGSKS